MRLRFHSTALLVSLLFMLQALVASPVEAKRRTLQFDIHVALPLSGLTMLPKSDDGFFQWGGGYLTLTVIDLWQVEAGGSAVAIPSGTGGEFLVRAGASFSIYRGNDLLGFELRVPALIGFSSASMKGEDEGNKSESTTNLARIETGLQLAHWFKYVGIFFRPLGGLVIDVNEGTLGFSLAATFGVSF